MLRSNGYRLFPNLGLKVAELSLNIVESSNLLGEGPLESRSLRVQLSEIECQQARNARAFRKDQGLITEKTAVQGFAPSSRPQDLQPTAQAQRQEETIRTSRN